MPTPLFVFGGWPWSERAVSLVSSENVFKAALSVGIDARKVTVSLAPDDGESVSDQVGARWKIVWDFNGETLSESEGVEKIRAENGIVFPVIHGEYWEDWTLQKILEDAGIHFVGSGSDSMELTIDKQKTGDRLSSLGFRTPKSFVVTTGTDLDSLGLEYPVIVKPKSEGSSVSLYKPASKKELEEVLEKEFTGRSEILVQEFVSGREFTCGVIGAGTDAQALVPTEVILTQSELFDYDAKYRAGACVEVTPAEVEPEVFERIRQTAKDVHVVCNCRDLSRTDMILNRKGELVVLEINTIPGMTGTSFVPAQLKAIGSSLEEFVRNVVDNVSESRKNR